MTKITESDMYYPLLLILKCYQGKATKEEIVGALALVIRAPKEYLETPSGFKTGAQRGQAVPILCLNRNWHLLVGFRFSAPMVRPDPLFGPTAWMPQDAGKAPP